MSQQGNASQGVGGGSNNHGQESKKYSGQAIVKAVLSGDSLILMGGASKGNLPEDKLVTLSGINAPRFARGKTGKDEPFAFAAREHLRRKAIGQRVFFSVNHSISGGDRPREYADVRLLADDTDLTSYVVRGGYATVKKGKDGKVPFEREGLLALQFEAEALGLGISNKSVNPEDQIRNCNWYPDIRQLFDSNRGTAIPCIVDSVREGHVCRLELLGKNLQHTMITTHLAGVICPRVPMPHHMLIQQWEKDIKTNPELPKPKKQKAAPFALEAQFFTEARLLHRNIKVLLHAVDKSGNIFGSLVFAKGDITQKIIESGFGKFVDWSAKRSGQADRLQAAERLAKQQHVGLWKDYNGKEEAKQAVPLPFMATVLGVPNGDTIVVQDPNNINGERKFMLASIRCPRIGYRNRAQDEPFAFEAREFIRRRVIGKKVQVIVEYTRAGSNGKEDREYATVLFNNADLAQGLLESGLASVLHHRVDEPRASRYEVLLRVDEKSARENRGINNTAPKTASHIVDLSFRERRKKVEEPSATDATTEHEDQKEKEEPEKSKGKQYLPLLQRHNMMDGVVEYVYSASKFKVYIPKENCVINLILAGIRTPSKDGNSKQGSSPMLHNAEMAAASLDRIKNRLYHHNVRIEVETCDRGDNFIGSVFLGPINVACELLQEGLAVVYGPSAERSKHSSDLYASEKSAKEQQKNLWVNYVELTPEEKAASGKDEEGTTVPKREFKDGVEFINVKVTEILDAVTFYVHVMGDKNIDVITNEMREFSEKHNDLEEGEIIDTQELKKGSVCAGYFNADGMWHRVKLERPLGDNWEVFYLDYGNRGLVSQDKLIPLPAKLAKLPGLATLAVLAGVNAPSSTSDYADDSTQALGGLSYDRLLIGRVELSERERLHLTLLEPESSVSINQQLLHVGHIRVQERPHRRLKKEFIAALQEDELKAKREFLGLWEYGDVSDDEEDLQGDDKFNRNKRN